VSRSLTQSVCPSQMAARRALIPCLSHAYTQSHKDTLIYVHLKSRDQVCFAYIDIGPFGEEILNDLTLAVVRRVQKWRSPVHCLVHVYSLHTRHVTSILIRASHILKTSIIITIKRGCVVFTFFSTISRTWSKSPFLIPQTNSAMLLIR